MNTNLIENKLKLLPDNLQNEVLDFIDFLLSKKNNTEVNIQTESDIENAFGILQTSQTASLEKINESIKQKGGHL